MAQQGLFGHLLSLPLCGQACRGQRSGWVPCLSDSQQPRQRRGSVYWLNLDMENCIGARRNLAHGQQGHLMPLRAISVTKVLIMAKNTVCQLHDCVYCVYTPLKKIGANKPSLKAVGSFITMEPHNSVPCQAHKHLHAWPSHWSISNRCECCVSVPATTNACVS